MLPPVLSSLAPPKPLPADPVVLLAPTAVSTPSVLSLLASQPSHYVSALLLGRRYILTARDILTVPKMKGVQPGDRIELTRILEVGSRDYTLRAMNLPPASSMAGVIVSGKKKSAAKRVAAAVGPLLTPPLARTLMTREGIPRDWQRHPDSLPALSSHVVQAHLVVLEHTKGSMFTVEKFKKRKGYRRALKSKLGFTKLRMGDISLGASEEGTSA